MLLTGRIEIETKASTLDECRSRIASYYDRIKRKKEAKRAAANRRSAPETLKLAIDDPKKAKRRGMRMSDVCLVIESPSVKELIGKTASKVKAWLAYLKQEVACKREKSGD